MRTRYIHILATYNNFIQKALERPKPQGNIFVINDTDNGHVLRRDWIIYQSFYLSASLKVIKPNSVKNTWALKTFNGWFSILSSMIIFCTEIHSKWFRTCRAWDLSHTSREANQTWFTEGMSTCSNLEILTHKLLYEDRRLLPTTKQGQQKIY